MVFSTETGAHSGTTVHVVSDTTVHVVSDTTVHVVSDTTVHVVSDTTVHVVSDTAARAAQRIWNHYSVPVRPHGSLKEAPGAELRG